MKNYFKGTTTHPQHISVGAILMNDKDEICSHHFNSKEFNFKGYWKDEGLDDFYLLMRKTVESDETLEMTLYRGLLEEFGAEAEIVDYIGSIQSYFKNKGSDTEIQKTTLYFLCKLRNQDLSRRGTGDVEFESQLEWHPAGFLIPKMKEQSARYGRTDIDESQILERLKTLNSV